jgi:hypothetical protein
MMSRRKLLPVSLLSVAALFVGLACPASSWADNQPKAKQQAAKKGAAARTAAEQGKLTEAEVLTNAVVLLAGANHDYDGHRAKAIHALNAAIKLLDNSVIKHGTTQQKAAASNDKAVVKGAEVTATKTPKIHENQAASDAQLHQAGKLLAQVRPTLVTHKQTKVLAHVDTAIKEIGIALKIR